jgi:hypothetical protein
LPIFIAGLFSLLSYRNVRRITRRQLSIVRRRLDRQLTKFVLTHVGFLIILLTSVVIYRIYEINIYVNPTDYFRLAIEGLILATVGSIFNLNYAVNLIFSISKRIRFFSRLIFIFSTFHHQAIVDR